VSTLTAARFASSPIRMLCSLIARIHKVLTMELLQGFKYMTWKSVMR
jgi:hypothetical protein